MVNKHFIGYSLFTVLSVGLLIALVVTNVNAAPAEPTQDGPVCCSSSTGSFDTNACSSDIQQLQANGWTYNETEKSLYKMFKVANFKAAFAWMTAVGMKAEQIQHHPEWFNVYSTIEVTWTTHDCPNGGDLSTSDIEMAQFCDEVVVEVP